MKPLILTLLFSVLMLWHSCISFAPWIHAYQDDEHFQSFATFSRLALEGMGSSFGNIHSLRFGDMNITVTIEPTGDKHVVFYDPATANRIVFLVHPDLSYREIDRQVGSLQEHK